MDQSDAKKPAGRIIREDFKTEKTGLYGLQPKGDMTREQLLERAEDAVQVERRKLVFRREKKGLPDSSLVFMLVVGIASLGMLVTLFLLPQIVGLLAFFSNSLIAVLAFRSDMPTSIKRTSSWHEFGFYAYCRIISFAGLITLGTILLFNLASFIFYRDVYALQIPGYVSGDACILVIIGLLLLHAGVDIAAKKRIFTGLFALIVLKIIAEICFGVTALIQAQQNCDFDAQQCSCPSLSDGLSSPALNIASAGVTFRIFYATLLAISCFLLEKHLPDNRVVSIISIILLGALVPLAALGGVAPMLEWSKDSCLSVCPVFGQAGEALYGKLFSPRNSSFADYSTYYANSSLFKFLFMLPA